jgi:hypothetical protein
MSRFGRGLAGWWEVMRGECSGHFGSGRGQRPAWCGACGRWGSVGFVLRKKKAGRGRLGRSGGRSPMGRGRAGRLGTKGGGRGWAENRSWDQSSRNKILSNFIQNLDFWQTLKISTRRFRRNFDMGICSKIF